MTMFLSLLMIFLPYTEFIKVLIISITAILLSHILYNRFPVLTYKGLLPMFIIFPTYKVKRPRPYSTLIDFHKLDYPIYYDNNYFYFRKEEELIMFSMSHL